MFIPTRDPKGVLSPYAISPRQDQSLLWVPDSRLDMSRRSFLGSTSRAVGTGLALPVIGKWETNPFAAEAQFWMFLFGLLQATAAVVTILQYLQARAVYASQVDYRDAGGCTKPLQGHEARMRDSGLTLFTSVVRSPLDRNVAALAGQTEPAVKLARVELATQYEGRDPVAIAGREISLVAAAAQFLASRYQLKGEVLARTMVIVNREENVHVIDPYYGNKLVPVTFFHNQGGGWFRYDKRPIGQATAGAIAVHLPPFTTDPDHPPMVGLVG